MTKAVDAHVIQKHVFGTNAQMMSDRHPLTPAVNVDEGGIIKEGEEIGTEEEMNDDSNHKINMIKDQCADHMMRNQGGRRSGNE